MKYLFQDSSIYLVKHLFQDSLKDFAKHPFQDSPKGPVEGLAKHLPEGSSVLYAAMKYDILFHRCVFQWSRR